MSRETYTPASDETIKVLTDHVKVVAEQMDVVPNYLTQILVGNECDSFLKFKRLYAACVRAGIDTSPWDAVFCSIKAQTRPDEVDLPIADKILRGADTTAKLVDALEDGFIDEREAEVIQKAICKERDTLDRLETRLACGLTPRAQATVMTRGKFAFRRTK